MTILEVVGGAFFELNGPKAPDELSNYAVRFFDEKFVVSHVERMLSQNVPNESKRQKFSEKRILLEIALFSYDRKIRTLSIKETRNRVEFLKIDCSFITLKMTAE